jgi:diguanylate cyclase (GGDEF)-like protein
MMEPPKPENETERLEALKKLKVLDTPPEERYERITRIVCHSLNVPISAVSLIDEGRQWFKSIQGLEVSETPRSVSFCGHAILTEEPTVVPDAYKDSRFKDSPLVSEDPKIRFYAGIPLTIEDNIRVGTLCAMGQEPREMTEDNLAALKDLAKMVQSELEALVISEAHQSLLEELKDAELAALIDPLSRLWNRAGGDKLFDRELEIVKRKGSPISIAMLDIDHFKTINDENGHDVGDEVIRFVSRTILSSLRPYDVACRWGGDEFLIIFPECDKESLSSIMERLYKSLRSSIETPNGLISVKISVGACVVRPGSYRKAAPLIKLADKALYEAKEKGRNQYAIVLADKKA